jgi:hypothetical protein
MIKPEPSDEISRLYSGERARTWFTQEAQRLATLFMEWAPNPGKRERLQDGQLVPKIIRDRWDQLIEILLDRKVEKERC